MPPTNDIESRELAAILEHSHDHFVIADSAGRIVKASVSCGWVYDVPPDELIGASVYALEEEGVLCPSITVRVLKTRAPCQLMQRTRTGRTVMAEAFPIWGAGKIVRVISFSKDMTDIQMLQREYELLHRQLAAREASQPAGEAVSADIPTCNPRMREMAALIERVAPTDASVLLLGETGVGKTRIASTLHRLSPRRDRPLVEANCGAIPESLFESEMFGYVAGAFSGAARGGKPGLAERADGGTLFLDEIAELSASAQAKLLRVLQDHHVTRLGSTEPRSIDFRLVTATNRDLAQRVADGHFRLDLYHRINVVPVTIPPLRERRDDIPLFIKHILDTLNARYGREKALSPDCWSTLLHRSWPGNLRELENVIERLYVTSDSELLEPDAVFASSASDPERSETAPLQRTLRDAVEAAEKACIAHAIEDCGSTYELARRVGVSQPTIFRKLKKYGLSLQDQ